MPLPASAATRQIISLKAGQWATESEELYDSSIGWYTERSYKIKVPKAGKLTFSFSKSDYKYAELSTSLTSDENSIGINNNTSVVVEKGTYYLDVRSGNCKYSFTAAPLQKNFCRAKAAKLSAKKTAKVYFTPTRSFSHWYKIKLPKKRKIKISFSEEHDFIIYNAKGKVCETVRNGSDVKYCTQKSQPKGTYYIRVLSDGENRNSYAFGEYVTFKWY